MASPTKNRTRKEIISNILIAAISLFINGFGVYLTIRASIGAGPWDVFSIGVSKTLGILYGSASILISFMILGIDIILREPIGIAMIIDSLVVGKSVDFFNHLNAVPVPKTIIGGILMILLGLTIMGYTSYSYMNAALGCGPRDTLLVGITKHMRNIPIGAISILLLATATLTGYFLGGPVGIGTLICAFATGPIMQLAFKTVGFEPTTVSHQNFITTMQIFNLPVKSFSSGSISTDKGNKAQEEK
ncbi:MAG: hypothetical protein K5773_05525 [Pseudobutyrivibrio sp.]|nr:hypothetical protein [Pseudobutyrivibrio sp.]